MKRVDFFLRTLGAIDRFKARPTRSSLLWKDHLSLLWGERIREDQGGCRGLPGGCCGHPCDRWWWLGLGGGQGEEDSWRVLECVLEMGPAACWWVRSGGWGKKEYRTSSWWRMLPLPEIGTLGEEHIWSKQSRLRLWPCRCWDVWPTAKWRCPMWSQMQGLERESHPGPSHSGREDRERGGLERRLRVDQDCGGHDREDVATKEANTGEVGGRLARGLSSRSIHESFPGSWESRREASTPYSKFRVWTRRLKNKCLLGRLCFGVRGLTLFKKIFAQINKNFCSHIPLHVFRLTYINIETSHYKFKWLQKTQFPVYCKHGHFRVTLLRCSSRSAQWNLNAIAALPAIIHL